MRTEPKDSIINCHVHTFTLNHVPRRFFWYALTVIGAGMPFKSLLGSFLRKAGKWITKDDMLGRYADLLETGARTSQLEVFDEVRLLYPEDTRFVVLPMDMDFMGAGTAEASLDEQHKELEDLVTKFGDAILPFVAIDPRRFEDAAKVLDYAKERLEKKRDGGERVFCGIKLYPALGFMPSDERLHDLYEYCETHEIPITTHTSRGGIGERGTPKSEVHFYSDPDRYREVLDRFPKLKLCMAHFGGSEEWNRYFDDPKSREFVDLDAASSERAHLNWLTKIMQMIDSERYENLYTDISYTVFDVRNFLAPLAVILRDNCKIKKRTLFGSDFYLSHQEEFEERYLSMKLRHALDEPIFDAIARENPRRFLSLK